MKQYKSQIEKATAKVEALKSGNKAYSANQLQKKIDNLSKFISRADEKGAEKAAEDLKEFADETVVPEVVEEVSATKKKK